MIRKDLPPWTICTPRENSEKRPFKSQKFAKELGLLIWREKEEAFPMQTRYIILFDEQSKWREMGTELDSNKRKLHFELPKQGFCSKKGMTSLLFFITSHLSPPTNVWFFLKSPKVLLSFLINPWPDLKCLKELVESWIGLLSLEFNVCPGLGSTWWTSILECLDNLTEDCELGSLVLVPIFVVSDKVFAWRDGVKRGEVEEVVVACKKGRIRVLDGSNTFPLTYSSRESLSLTSSMLCKIVMQKERSRTRNEKNLHAFRDSLSVVSLRMQNSVLTSPWTIRTDPAILEVGPASSSISEKSLRRIAPPSTVER